MCILHFSLVLDSSITTHQLADQMYTNFFLLKQYSVKHQIPDNKVTLQSLLINQTDNIRIKNKNKSLYNLHFISIYIEVKYISVP